MSENQQYDNALGGVHELPASVRLFRFTAARCKEIQTLKWSLSTSKGGKLAFQKLPIHMRRRIMSHNANRLPRRLREIHINQLKKSGLGTKQKIPSRKYRRRPRNLCAEYLRRQRKCKWLETHIWHAKRFHMIERWGYKIPQSSCDKSFRACYRASTKHCLLEDVSYIGCIEINATEKCITENFSKICDKNVNMSIGAKAFINGNREGKLTLFSNGTPLGIVNFHWMPTENDSINRKLWIWTHAAFFNSVLSTFVNLFNLKLEQDHATENYYRNEETNVFLYDLRFDLNRFRLTGPLSHAILQKSLTPANLQTHNANWLEAYSDERYMKAFTNQATYWKQLQNISSTAELSPHIIIGLILTDPRYNMPKKRSKALADNSQIPSWNAMSSFPENLNVSPIWNKSVRKFVKENMVSNSNLCEIRRKLLVPGTHLDVPAMPVPYLLIQRPGNRTDSIGFCSGWDIIIPSGWAQPTWLTFIMWGARAGGLREAESNLFEMGLPSIFEPDTESGEQEDARYTKLYREKYFRLPPNKRVNYNKFAIATPFECKWKVLLRDWNCFPSGAKYFYVLRDRNLLQMIQHHLTKHLQIDKLDVNFQVPYLVPVKLVFDKKGHPNRYSIICLPKKEDLKSGVINEPKRADKNEVERYNLRRSHKMLLKKMCRYRKKCRLLGKKYIPKINYIEEYKRKMADLWVPDVQSQIKNSCSREIIGWSTKGDFSFFMGKSVAIGYVVMGSLPALFSSFSKNKVLVRNTSSRQYRIATLEIVL